MCIEACDQVLASNKGDLDALRVRCMCHIRLGEFGKALQGLSRPEVQKDFGLERAYCYYRQGKLKESLKACRAAAAAGNDSPTLKHLLAHVCYGLGSYEEAAKGLEELQEDEAELLPNLQAALVAMGKEDAVSWGDVGEEASLELLYNAGTAATLCGDLESGEALLGRALDLCGGEEGKSKEEAYIRAQLAYTKAKGKGGAEASVQHLSELVESMAADGPCDPTARLITQSNLAVARGRGRQGAEIERSVQEVKDAMTPEAVGGVSGPHLEAIRNNMCLLLLHVGKGEAELEELNRHHPDSSLPLLLEAARLLKRKKITECETLLSNLQKKLSGQSKDEVSLSLAQVKASQGKLKTAAAVLKEVRSVAGYPATVATISAMHNKAKEPELAVNAVREGLKQLSTSQSLAGEQKVRSPGLTLATTVSPRAWPCCAWLRPCCQAASGMKLQRLTPNFLTWEVTWTAAFAFTPLQASS
ncbi:unnamed protein product [Chrysoparadoxa australica]